jgi:DNA-3-methyladenine glycosylase
LILAGTSAAILAYCRRIVDATVILDAVLTHPAPPKLPREFYARRTLTVARQLIGMHLVHDDAGTRRVGRIVETEAYLGPKDLAAHSSRGRTQRNDVMFGPAGFAYVYFIYGVWYCMNVVTREVDVPQAVLLRGLEPIENLSDKTWGPGLLCRAMNIDRSLNGTDLLGSTLWIERPPELKRRVRVTRAPRIGVAYAGEWAQRLWRFYDRDSLYVSTARRSASTPDRPRAGGESTGSESKRSESKRNASTPGSRMGSDRPSRR